MRVIMRTIKSVYTFLKMKMNTIMNEGMMAVKIITAVKKPLNIFEYFQCSSMLFFAVFRLFQCKCYSNSEDLDRMIL